MVGSGGQGCGTLLRTIPWSALQTLQILSRLLPPLRFSVFLRRASGFMHLYMADVGVRARVQKSKISSSVGPVLLGFFVFVVVGSGASQEDTVWKLLDVPPGCPACRVLCLTCLVRTTH